MMTPALAMAALLTTVFDGGAADAARADAGVPDVGAGADARTDADNTPLPISDLPPPLPRAPLQGRVFARGSRKPVAAASLTVDTTYAGDTDSQGRFKLEAPCGNHHLNVQAPGFEPLMVQRDPCADASPIVVRLLPRAGAETYETVVRTRTSRQAVKLEGEELVRTPGTLGDPFRAIESMPGVTAVAWPAPVYAIRGANPGNTGFFLDDLRVPGLFHFALGPSVIHPYFFQDLDFYPGGYPARYGRYVAGIVAARTRPPPDDDLHASVDVRLFDAGAMVTSPLPGNGAVAAAARYSYTGLVIGQLSDSGFGISYWDYQLRADRAWGPVRLTLLALGSNDRMTTTRGGVLALRFHRVKARADVALAGGILNASLGLGSDRSEAPIAYDLPVSMSALSAFPRLAFSRPSQHVDVEVGFDGELQRFAAHDIVRLGTLDLARARTVRLLAGYASAVVKAGDRLLLTPEVRLDSYAIGGTTAVDVGPRLSGRLALDTETWVRIMAGRFTQLPSLPLQVPGAENFGLALYGLQTSWQGSLAVGTTRVWGLETSVTGYVQRYFLTDVRDPIITRSFDPLADDYLVRRDALSYGAEFMVRRAPSQRLHGWLAYTLSRNLRALGAGVIGPSDWDQRHVVNLVLGYRAGRYTFGGRAHVHTGRPVLVSSAQGQEFVRLPTFYQVDLRCDRRFTFDKFVLDAYVELVNATLSRQIIGLTQQAANAEPTQDGFRIVLPSIGVHAQF